MNRSKPPANGPELLALLLSLIGTLLSICALMAGGQATAYLLLIGGFSAMLAAYCFHE